MKLKWRRAGVEDVSRLAHWNKQLIEDEGSRNPMTPAQLETRMMGWMQGNDWDIWMLERGGESVGYAVLRVAVEDSEIFLRQFFIAREYRSQGVGKVALEQLRSHFTVARWTLEVLETNPRARKFYESLGFTAYASKLEWVNI